jgi:cytidine deaminase
MKNLGRDRYNFETYNLTKRECTTLIAKGEEAIQFTYPKPGKGYAVALITRNGNIYTGASYLSDTQNLTMHSEAVALSRAAQHGETEIIAITGPNCHNCKQLIWESAIRSKINTIIIVKDGDDIRQIPISELMPYPWPDHRGQH